MKKHWGMAAVSVLGCCLMLGACGKQQAELAGSQTESQGETETLYSWKEIRDEKKTVEEKLASGGYGNLKGEIPIQMPEFEEVSGLHVSYLHDGSSLKEFVEDACELIQKIRGEVHRDQIEVTGLDWDMGIFATDIEEEIETGDSIYEDYTGMLYHGEKELGEYMQLGPNKLSTWTNGGVISSLVNEEQLSLHPDLGHYEGENYDLRLLGGVPDVSYPVLDGEMTLQEAIDIFEDAINVDENYFFENPNPDMKYEVVSAKACVIQEDLYAYYLQLTQAYKGIKRDTFDLERNNAYHVEGFDEVKGEPCLADAMVIEKGKVDATMNCDRVCQIEEVGEPVTEGRSLDELLTELSERLTKGTTFDVLSVEFLYQVSEFWSEGQNVVYEWRPVWKVYCQNRQDLGYYDFYIDPVTGAIQAREEH